MDIFIVLILLTIGIIMIIISILNPKSIECPPQQVIYQQVPENILDMQYSKENRPSNIYLDMFNKSSPWIGGFTIGNKAFVSDKKS
jgi:hypothetical protein|uniref:Uncharacterized protein n=1 Tax=viral metagenome TaxID=1070528 RepID=A0A6C0ALN2_9ZZZZ